MYKNSLDKPLDETNYKMIDLDALSAICTDFGVSAEWLLLGRGKMLKSENNAHPKGIKFLLHKRKPGETHNLAIRMRVTLRGQRPLDFRPGITLI